jgi:hypothetical protein
MSAVPGHDTAAVEQREAAAKPRGQVTSATAETLPFPTSSDADAFIDPVLAVMVAVPATMLLANPVPPMVATDVIDEVQLTDEVRSWVLPSL